MADQAKGPSKGKAKKDQRWEADVELEEFKKFIRERSDKILEATKVPRMIWLAFAIIAFVVAIIVIIIGIQAGDLTTASIGSVMETLLGLPISQLRKIQSDVGRVVALPMRLEVRLKKCELRAKSRDELVESYASVMDEIDDIFREWSETDMPEIEGPKA
jgi:hypothetical protein